MPADQGFGLDHGHSFSPGKQLGKQHEGQAGSDPGSARFDFAFQVKRHLLVGEQLLAGQGTPRVEAKWGKSQGIQT
jgi:hypothetical protein